MSKSNPRVDNWIFSSLDGEYAGILINVPRVAVEGIALDALNQLAGGDTYTEVKYTRYQGSTLILAFKPNEEDEFAEISLADADTTQALYAQAGWPLTIDGEE